MNIIHLTAGTGSFFCGTCIRDNALVRGLRALGHTADLIPLYMPIVSEGASCSASQPVLMSGINCYLQQNISAFRHIPPWLDRGLAARPLLQLASRQSGKTRPEDTGAMTVSMLQGRRGFQAKEVDRLIAFLRGAARPDVIVLSNSLLVGLAEPLHAALNVPVVCTLQGEYHFLEAMGPPWTEQAWTFLTAGLEHCSGLIAVSDFVAGHLARRTGTPRSRIDVVHNGIDTTGFRATSDPQSPYVLGFLARLYERKGLDALAHIFAAVRAERDDVVLAVAGTLNEGDQADVDRFVDELDRRQLMPFVRIEANLSEQAKHEFLSGLTVFCVPSAKDETFGLYHLEALASEVPVVAGRRGAVPEVLEQTGGAVLVEEGDIDGFAQAILALLDDRDRRRTLGQAGRKRVEEAFTHTHMAAREVAVLERIAGMSRTKR